MRPPPEAKLPAPEFPADLDWVGSEPLQMRALSATQCVLVEFWDFARVNSLRTLPYLEAWHERYGDRGLQVVGVHCPGYSFGREHDAVAHAVERLAVPYPVAVDSDFRVWREYGNKGWPGRYLFDRTSRLRLLHYGEGEYADTELAIQECLAEIDPDFDPPDPMEPLRPEDAPGVLLEPQSADLAMPGDRAKLELVRDWTDGEDWIEAADAGAAALVSFQGGAAWAVLSGGDVEPGVHETDGEVVAQSPGLRLHGFQFTPAAPPP